MREIEPEQPGQRTVAHRGHLQDHQPSAAVQDAAPFGKCGLSVGQIANHKGADDRIDRAVAHRQAQRVGAGQPAPGTPRPVAAGQQHRVRKVDTQGKQAVRAPPPGQGHQVAGSRPYVEQDGGLVDQGQIDHPPPPAAVEPEADHAVEAIVGRGDGVKHRPDLWRIKPPAFSGLGQLRIRPGRISHF